MYIGGVLSDDFETLPLHNSVHYSAKCSYSSNYESKEKKRIVVYTLWVSIIRL